MGNRQIYIASLGQMARETSGHSVCSYRTLGHHHTLKMAKPAQIHLLLKPIEGQHHVYDVWIGEGWMNWMRIKVDFQTKTIEHLKGLQMTFNIRNALRNYLKLYA